MKVIIVAVVLVAVLGTVFASEDTCNNPGESKFDGCNTCTCTETGLWACTQKLCYRPKREEGRCTNPGETKFDGCNTCTCTKTGVWACTRKLCFRRKRDGISLDALEPIRRTRRESRCTPGQRRQEDCNTCICSEKELWICTEIGCLDYQRQTRNELEREHPVVRQRRDTQGLTNCPALNNVIRCNTGLIEKIDCYTYNCSKSGIWICIEDSCDPSGSATETAVLKRVLPLVRERRDTKVLNCPPLNNVIRCNTGDIHKTYCYTYNCSATGVWICTDDTCPQGPPAESVPSLLQKRSTQELDCPALNNVDPCNEGEIFRDDCYTYICSDIGIWVCTEQLCLRR